MNRIFLSYHGADESWVRSALTLLRRSDQYRDSEVTDPTGWTSNSESARALIKGAVRNADLLLLFWSDSAASDPWVHYQLGVALAVETPVRVLLAEENVPALPWYLVDTEQVEVPA